VTKLLTASNGKGKKKRGGGGKGKTGEMGEKKEERSILTGTDSDAT
jgi:hypothetical protein